MKKDTLIALCIAGIVLIVNNLPILYFALIGSHGMVYMGRRDINSQDMYTYISYIEQSKQGALLLKNLFTSEPQTATLLRPSYLLLGKIASLFQISSVMVYHLARIVLSLFFFIILYQFLSLFFTRPRSRLLAFAIVLSSSGIGWLVGTIVTGSIDLWVPEANTFLMLAESPHFILAQILLLGGFLSFLSYLHTRRWRMVFLMCCCFSLLSLEHPFNLLMIAPVIFGTGVLSGLSLMPAALIAIGSSIWLLYPLILLRQNALFALEQSQGSSISPAPLQFLVGYGALIPLALFGMERKAHEKKPALILLFLWTACSTIALYAPVTFQRRLSEGLHIPIAIFASFALISLYSYLRRRRVSFAPLVIVGAIIVLAFSSVRAITQDFLKIRQDTTASYYFSLLPAEIDAMNWLKDHSNVDDVILSNWFYGNYIAGFTGRTVYIGHRAQTIRIDEKIDKVNVFLRETDPEKSLRFLQEENISLIFIKDHDSLSEYGFLPDTRAYLTKVYDHESVKIYSVNQPNPHRVRTQMSSGEEERKP